MGSGDRRAPALHGSISPSPRAGTAPEILAAAEIRPLLGTEQDRENPNGDHDDRHGDDYLPDFV
jgi:hypothetical protein